MSASAVRARARPRAELEIPAITVEKPPIRRGLFRRRNNRRITVGGASMLAGVTGFLRALGRRLAFVGKALAVVALLVGAAVGGRQAVRHVIASPRFSVREIRIGATRHASADELRALSGIRLGDRLLAVDPDAVAARLATHPWVASARVRRDLPATLAVEVTERQAVASALLGALYLVDDSGRPFKRATLEEADGLPVLTGVTRDQYAAMRSTSEAVFRQELSLLHAYAKPGQPGVERPRLSEIHADARNGFTAVLLDGGGQVRLGHGDWAPKLEALDQILAALDARGPAAISVVFLDGAPSDRVTLRLNPLAQATGDPPPTALSSKKFRLPDKRGED